MIASFANPSASQPATQHINLDRISDSIPAPTILPARVRGAESLLEDLAVLVQRQPASWQPVDCIWNRRLGHRTPFQGTLWLTPLDDVTDRPCAEPSLVKANDISLHGLRFTHDTPLPFRKVALTFGLVEGGEISFLTRLKWCRFTSTGCYESGGQFLKEIDLKLPLHNMNGKIA